jgi:hypothetical protein
MDFRLMSQLMVLDLSDPPAPSNSYSPAKVEIRRMQRFFEG